MKKQIKGMSTRLFVLASAVLALMPGLAFAQADKFGTFLGFVAGWIDALIGIFIGFAMIAFFWGLTKFIGNAGDEGKRKEGKQLMAWGILAMTVIVSIWGIVKFIQVNVGVEDTTTIGRPGIPGGTP